VFGKVPIMLEVCDYYLLFDGISEVKWTFCRVHREAVYQRDFLQ